VFFLTPRPGPGPTRAPAKNAARERIIELRRAGHSAKEIAEAGFPRLPVRPPSARGAPYRDHPRRAELLDFAALPARSETKLAGLALAVPELVALDLPGLVAAAGYPGTAVIPAVNYLLSLLALKLVGIRRVSHVDDLAADAGAGLFAGLAALPKATALSTYSYRLDHTRQLALLAALGTAMLAADLIADAGGDLDLDFHAIMHWGADVALEKNALEKSYVPSRFQRTRSVLSFFAQDGASHTLVYANADLTKATQAHEALRLRRALAGPDRALTGRWPALLVMDQKVTTQPVLGRARRPRHHLPHPADALTGANPPHRAAAGHRLAGRAARPRRRLPPPAGGRRAGRPERLPGHCSPARRHRARPGRSHRPHHQRSGHQRQAAHRALRPPDEHRTAPR